MPLMVSILKMTASRSRLISSLRDAQLRELAAVGHAGDGRRGWPPALPDISRTTSKPSTMPSSALHVGEVGDRRVDDDGGAHALRDGAPIGVRLADDDVAGAGVAHDRGGHEADGPGAGDEHVLAQHLEAERGVHGVAEGVEDGGHLLVDAGPVVPHVRHRQGDVLGEGPVTADAEADAVGAEVAPTGQAVAAAPADDVALAADEVARRRSR